MLKSLLLAALLAAPAAFAQTSPSQTPDQSKLLASIRSRYDIPWSTGLSSFACTVQFDWNAHLSASLHRPVPATDPIVKALTTSHATVMVDSSGAHVTTFFQDPQPINGSAAFGLEQALENVIVSSIASWLPFSSASILPVGKTNYLILPTETGYRIDLTGDEITGTLELDHNYGIQRSSSKLGKPGQFTGPTVRLETTFSQSPHGLELTHLHTLSTPSTPGKPASESTLEVSYQTVNTTAIPQTFKVQSGSSGSQWTIILSGCSVTTR